MSLNWFRTTLQKSGSFSRFNRRSICTSPILFLSFIIANTLKEYLSTLSFSLFFHFHYFCWSKFRQKRVKLIIPVLWIFFPFFCITHEHFTFQKIPLVFQCASNGSFGMEWQSTTIFGELAHLPNSKCKRPRISVDEKKKKKREKKKQKERKKWEWQWVRRRQEIGVDVKQ